MGLGKLASPRCAVAIGGLALLLALTLCGPSAAEKTVHIPIPAVPPPGPLFDGGFAPKVLPRVERAPIELGISGKVEPLFQDSNLPTLRKVIIEGDRAVAVDVSGWSTCSAAELQKRRAPAAAKELCRSALVGHGTAVTGTIFPGTELVIEKNKVVIFNGGREEGVTTFLIYTYLRVPDRTALVATAKVKKIDNGRYGLEAAVSIPEFADDFGLTTAFDLVFDRGVFLARCSTGVLQGKGTAVFRDGTQVSSAVVSTCRARTSAARSPRRRCRGGCGGGSGSRRRRPPPSPARA